MRSPDARIERLDKPVVLSLEAAVDWIKHQRPIIWLGSIASVPEPAGFPSGFALTKSLLSLVLIGAIPREEQEPIVDALARQWPLEALLDEFEWLRFDIAESMLTFFNKQNQSASPTLLHDAVVHYYQEGLAKMPLCITTNWDTLVEKAFRSKGVTVVTAGPDWQAVESFRSLSSSASNTVFVYHPHGSFERKDVVCSFRQEQSQLSLHPDLIYQPTLFLGYSGYEPSLYSYLEHGIGQLWCIRNSDELQIPAKRRLLCRPNTFTYIGDICDLLLGLGVLDRKVEIKSRGAGYDGMPSEVVDVVRLSTLCSLEPAFAVNMLAHTLLAFTDGVEDRLRYVALMRGLVNHIRNRSYHPAVLTALVSAARFRNSEQTWISILAYLLRHDRNLPTRVVKRILDLAGQAPSSGLKKRRRGSAEDMVVYGFGLVKQRANIYKSFLKEAKKIDDWRVYVMMPLLSADLAALGESCEVWAFEKVREGHLETASNLFDYAATCFYLRGLWNAGRLNEWAAGHPEALVDIAKGNSLIFPIQPEFGSGQFSGATSS